MGSLGDGLEEALILLYLLVEKPVSAAPMLSAVL
jgi:hypothetical protein